MDNVILSTDSYKFTHWKQYPKKTQFVRSYLESRGGLFPKVVTVGLLNYFVREVLSRPITWSMIVEAEQFVNEHIGPGVFNRAGWEHILREHDGFLPLRVRAVPEGLFVPVKNALMTIENTDPVVPWLVNYMETTLYPWYPYTVATLSNTCRRTMLRYLHRNGTPERVDFMLQDFGYRGVSSEQSAGIGGFAHLFNFKGSDTPPAIMFGRKYYGVRMAGFSIPAAEHSTITSWGRDHEGFAYDNMMDAFPTGPIAVVSDSYNIYEACEKLWGELLHDKVLARDGVLIIRPDSGDPPTVVMKCLEILGRKFGVTYNEKNFRLLNPKVRLIQGDGVDPVVIDRILFIMELNGWSADNIGFGMGGGLLQQVNRDTMKWKIACSSVVIDGVEHGVYKSPVTDPGKADGHYYTAEAGGSPSGMDVMRDIYVNGLAFNLDDHAAVWDRLRRSERTELNYHEPDCAAQHDDAEAQCKCTQ